VDTAVAVVKATPPTADTKPVPNPALEACPVKWEIRYNDKVQPVSGSLLPEPEESDKVSFVLTNPSKIVRLQWKRFASSVIYASCTPRLTNYSIS